MKSVMRHAFSQVPKAEIPRSSFDRSHGYKTTFDAGYLIPFLVDEALPGDTYKVSATGFARMATPVFPVMDNMFMETHFFAVPIRLLWDNWQKFNGEQTNPDDSTDYTLPQMTSPVGGYLEGSLHDYMGLPTAGQVEAASTVTHTSLPLRAYNLIWNEWFRDQNLQDAVQHDTSDGPNGWEPYTLLKRGKRHDYFTSCLPWPQKGPGVQLPIGESAPVFRSATGFGKVIYGDGSGGVPSGTVALSAGDQATHTQALLDATNKKMVYDPNGTLSADLSQATSATINSLRQAFQVQKILERDARGGTRYTEIIKAHFGVTSPDARLQRPEYLGGGSTPINFQPVPQTSGGGAYTPTPQGNLAAYATATVNGHGFNHSFTEHCVIIGLMSVRADLTYQQGLNRMWSRKTRFDFYWPALSHIGEQAVLNKEIYARGIQAQDDGVFGYQERYAEYRYKPSQITGAFRSTSSTPLDAWHLSQEFSGLPTLSPAFIEESPPIDRVIAIPGEPHFLFDSYIKMHCARPMPVYGVPGLIDHF